MLKIEDIVAEVKRLGTEKPNETRTCRYELFGEPNCIVGEALFNLGISAERLARLDGMGASSFKEIVIYSMLPIEAPHYVPVNWVWHVQREQDQGATWGVAVEHAGPI